MKASIMNFPVSVSAIMIFAVTVEEILGANGARSAKIFVWPNHALFLYVPYKFIKQLIGSNEMTVLILCPRFRERKGCFTVSFRITGHIGNTGRKSGALDARSVTGVAGHREYVVVRDAPRTLIRTET